MDKRFDIIIAGVGGQGILLASDIIGEACMLEGIPVKGAEVHGMAQRGGSVESHIRIGGVHGPRVSPGKTDLLLAFEPLEAARYAVFLKKGGTAVVNTFPIRPSGIAEYPDVGKLLSELNEVAGRIVAMDFTSVAIGLGSARVLNVIMIGAAAKYIPLAEKSIVSALRRIVKSRFVELNIAAFKKGMETVSISPRP